MLSLNHRNYRFTLCILLIVLVVAGRPIPAQAQSSCLTIAERYTELGGKAGFLGQPISKEQAAPDGIGRYQHYKGGSIYWSSETCAHEVYGAIRDKWQSLGWERGFLGYPITGELPTADGYGRFNHFQHGSIYWSPWTYGAREVHGSIRDHWASQGWEQGPLGYPTTDELPTRDGNGRVSQFEFGSIECYPDNCAFASSFKPIVRVEVSNLKAHQTTEDNIFNDRDEVYFVCTGGTTQGREISLPRISPGGDENYYQYKNGWERKGILLWQGWLDRGETVELGCSIVEQDNGSIREIVSLVTLATITITSIITGCGACVFVATGASIIELNEALKKKGHQVIGSFQLSVTSHGETATVRWRPNESANIFAGPDMPQNPSETQGSSVAFSAYGAESRYSLGVSAWQP